MPRGMGSPGLQRYLKGFCGYLRRIADYFDPVGAPCGTHYTFTFEEGRGLVFREDGKGCPVWYLGQRDYELAFLQADTEWRYMRGQP